MGKNIPENLLSVAGLTVYYDSVLALDNVDINIIQGKITVIIGPNGAGKSTALKAISGLISPRSGDIIYNGEKINGLQPFQLVYKGISLVPEGRHVFPTMTVYENLEMGAFTISNKGIINENIDKIYNLFPILKERFKQKAGTLSSGEQQMLAIGRALMLKPKLLLLDEPSLGLSPNYVETVFEKIMEINATDTTILLVEQNANKALENSDFTYVFGIGKIELSGKSEELIKNNEVKKAFLGE